MTLHEKGVHARGDGGGGEQGGTLGPAPAGFGRAGQLRGVGGVEADGRPDLQQVAEADEVVDEPVVSEEGSALGEHLL